MSLSWLLLFVAQTTQVVPLRNPSTPNQSKDFHAPVVGMPMSIRMKAFEDRRAMLATSPLKNLPWRQVGPVRQGGRVNDIQAPKDDSNKLFVAYATGGLYRTENEGMTWTSLFDDQSAFGIGSFALNHDASTIWVGSGEANSQRTSYSGTGIFKSIDSGKTWLNMGLPESHHISRVLIDPRNENMVWVGVLGHLYSENEERGVYVTRDGGKTWVQSLKLDSRTGIVDLVMDPRDSNTLYAAAYERSRRAWDYLESGPGSALYKTSDGGRTWKKLSIPGGESMGRVGLAVAPSQSNRLYAFIDAKGADDDSDKYEENVPTGELTLKRFRGMTWDAFKKLDDKLSKPFVERLTGQSAKIDDTMKKVKDGTLTRDAFVELMLKQNPKVLDKPGAQAQVWRSNDAGKTWLKVADHMGGHGGYYYNRTIVSPTNPDELFTTGVLLLHSIDGGVSWEQVANNIHVDYHMVFIDPKRPKRVFAGEDGGLCASYDGGETWKVVNSLPVGQFTTIAVDNKRPYHIIGGLQDNGTMRGPSTHVPGVSDPSEWEIVSWGDGSAIAVDPRNDGDTIYTASQFGSFYGFTQSKNERWYPHPATKKGDPELRFNWIAPIIASSHHPDIIYVGSQKVHRSFDQGRTFKDISPDLTKNRKPGNVPHSSLTQLSESPLVFGRIYAGADDGSLHTTPDGGVTWVDIATPAPDRWVTRVVASKFAEGRVYVSQNGYRQNEWTSYVWVSEDFGKTWRSISVGLPAEAVNTIREDPTKERILYVGTDMGVYVSVDRGTNWLALGTGMPNTPIHDVAIQARDQELVAASHARSIFAISLKYVYELTPELAAKPINLYSMDDLNGRKRWGYEDRAPYEARRHSEISQNITLYSKVSADATLTLKDKVGKVVKTMARKVDRGFNFFTFSMLLKAGDPKAPLIHVDPNDPASALLDPYEAQRPVYPPSGDYTLEVAIGAEKAVGKFAIQDSGFPPGSGRRRQEEGD